jgi:predicted flap endonuclease-1-like 5' DNA nuclease
MNLLFRIVYAAHASGTHHKLALDALRHLQCMDADLWQRLFLAHAKLYLEGSKAPDTEFKDFKNHVLHTRDGYWGGAPDKVRSWYHHLVEALAQQDWPTAVHCAGVLSHYYTDPLQPLHTAQSEAENNVHRAIEWSISKAYDELARQGETEFADMSVELPPGPNWLAQLVCQGAERANRYYEKLIAHYDIQRGVVDPPRGLDPVSRRFIAELLRYATLSYAAVLDRAIGEANVHAPDVSLAGATLAAVAQVPFKVIARRIADKEERCLVEQMYDELLATGTVETHLSEDDRAVRDLHAAEVLAKRPPQPAVSKVFPFKVGELGTAGAARQPAAGDDRGGISASSNVVPLHAAAPPATVASAPQAAEQVSHEDAPPAEPIAARPRPKSGLLEQLERMTVAPAPPRTLPPQPQAAPAVPAEPRFHLTLDHDVVDGPTIGPKTADRLYPHGIKTVRDLIKAEPAALAVLLDNRHIMAETITDWQDQARLVCTVPGLRGTHAQLLVGAGYRSAEAIAVAEADKLCADVLAFAASKDGQRVLRSGDPPDIEKIKGWLEAALSVKAA